MHKKKILISTLYNSMNVGARLQSYALYKYLSDHGYKVEFYKGGARKPLKETIKKAKKAFKRKSLSSLIFCISKYFRMQSIKLALPVVSVSKARKQFADYSALICGSDEIWNLKLKNKSDYPYLVGQGIDINKKISYAASIGDSEEDDLRKVEWFETELKKFSAISVREEPSVKIIEDISGKKVTHVLDPVFLIDWSHLYKASPQKCIFLYLNSKLARNKEFKDKITSFARKNGLKIISLGELSFRCSWADKFIPMDSKVFLYYMFNSQYVVSNTFHGTAFAVLSNSKFIAFDDGPSFKKIQSLLHYLHLDDRLVDLNSDVEELFQKPIDYDSVNKILKEAKSKSEDFLIKAINE